MTTFSVTSKPDALEFVLDVETKYHDIVTSGKMQLAGEQWYPHAATHVIKQTLLNIMIDDDGLAALIMLEYGSKYGLKRSDENPKPGFVHQGIRGVDDRTADDEGSDRDYWYD